MLNAETRAELAKLGLGAIDLETNVATLSWGDLHGARKRLRRSVNDPAGETAFNVIGERIADISDEIDRREADGEREPNAARIATERREAETAPRLAQIAAARRAFETNGATPRRGAIAPAVADEVGAMLMGATFRAALLGDHSGLSPDASQVIGSGAAGGFLVPQELWGSVQRLAVNKMRTREAGATITDQSGQIVGATVVPTVESEPTPMWRGELQDIEASAMTFGTRAYNPHTLAVFANGSIEAMEDAQGLGALLLDSFATQLALGADYAALNGDGVGKPLGLLNQPNVQSINAGGALTSYSPFARAIQKVRERNVEPGAFILSPSTMGAIDRLTDTTGQPLQMPPSLQGRAFLDTNQVDRTDTSPVTASAITGEWSSLFVIFRTALVLEISRTSGTDFKNLGWSARGYTRVDSFAIRPDRFCKVENLPAA
ncbi:MAG: hypothetical protein BroJett013_22940 [Alphaproteobacteria bacterium]|nr:MAG: hypothetical protein BroJett013_22940 [Alphaproteobacteria bacterium]